MGMSIPRYKTVIDENGKRKRVPADEQQSPEKSSEKSAEKRKETQEKQS